MILILYIILVAAGLACWFWLASRISLVSNTGALLSLILVLPAFYWTYKLWNSPRAALRRPAVASFSIITVLVAVFLLHGYYTKSQVLDDVTHEKANPQMMRWCREQNDGVYDPTLKVCVEPTKADVAADEAKENAMGQFEQYLNEHGLAGKIDRTETAETKAIKESPDVADAVSFRLNEQSAGQPPLIIALCLSQSAGTHLANRQKKDTGNVGVGKGRLMLLLPADAMDDTRLKSLKKVIAGFTPAAP